jgi:hypothetical protein
MRKGFSDHPMRLSARLDEGFNTLLKPSPPAFVLRQAASAHQGRATIHQCPLPLIRPRCSISTSRASQSRM